VGLAERRRAMGISVNEEKTSFIGPSSSVTRFTMSENGAGGTWS